MLNQDLLLNTKLARELYHDVAKLLPIVDYHNHLNPQAMASNRKFNDITDLWIHDDQYKHRLMRINGIEEKYITGNGSPQDKFSAWIKTYPKTLGNPLYHWSQIELDGIFNLDIQHFENDPLSLWEQCNEQLGANGIGAVDILKKWNIEILSTSDDLLDDLEPHRLVTEKNPWLKVSPSLRGDSMCAFESEGFLNWLSLLSQQTNIGINSLDTYLEAIKIRLSVFQQYGCVLSDHALDSGFKFALPSGENVARQIFKKVLEGESLNDEELISIKSFLLYFLGVEYGKRKLTMQLHIGAQRTTSSRLKSLAGKFGGFATIGNPLDIVSLTGFLDSLERAGALPNTILYTLNPSDNERIATLTGSFTDDATAGKIQFGPAWWFNDHYDGIKRQLTDVASYGLLNTFIGMTSDSRSFMSLSRHYYFRRILCHLLGEWAEQGIVPDNAAQLARLVHNVCYANAKNLVLKGNI